MQDEATDRLCDRGPPTTDDQARQGPRLSAARQVWRGQGCQRISAW